MAVFHLRVTKYFGEKKKEKKTNKLKSHRAPLR